MFSKTETCPAVFMKDDRVVEVAMTKWGDNDGFWNLAEDLKLELGESADRIIFELPIGCFETQADLEAGPVTLMNFGASSMPRCERVTQQSTLQTAS